jgi:hypothetical protein
MDTARFTALLVGALLLLLALVASPARAGQVPWREHDANGEVRVHLYFFWSESCPHCQAARPVVEQIDADRPWLELHEHEISTDPEARELYLELAAELGEEARYVPALAFCETLVQGFPGEAELVEMLERCRESGVRKAAGEPPPPETEVSLPLLGEVDLGGWSLPLTTVVLAGLDAFNPCAFFVLLFLLSLLVRSHSRGRMLVISAIFIVFSGLLYFVFMAAWLNLFLWLGELRWITISAGVVAVVMAGINIKDFFAPARGPSLSIPESAKPSLFARMRKLARASSLASAVVATVVLATAANTYELLCTAGLPMIYTRVLTMAELSAGAYYLYLGLYNLVYVIPLIVIVAISMRTLGRRKLQEHEGRALKLLSGLMMLGLGVALLVAPGLLGHVGVAVALLAGAGVVTAVAVAIERRVRGPSRPTPRHGDGEQ